MTMCIFVVYAQTYVRTIQRHPGRTVYAVANVDYGFILIVQEIHQKMIPSGRVLGAQKWTSLVNKNYHYELPQTLKQKVDV